MWPVIANFADDFTDRLEHRTRTPVLPAPRTGNRWVVRSLRGTGARLVRYADRLDAPRPGAEIC